MYKYYKMNHQSELRSKIDGLLGANDLRIRPGVYPVHGYKEEYYRILEGLVAEFFLDPSDEGKRIVDLFAHAKEHNVRLREYTSQWTESSRYIMYRRKAMAKFRFSGAVPSIRLQHESCRGSLKITVDAETVRETRTTMHQIEDVLLQSNLQRFQKLCAEVKKYLW